MRYSGVFKCFKAMGVLFVFSIAQQKIDAQPCPCDIYAAGGTPCVAAHSVVRAPFTKRTMGPSTRLGGSLTRQPWTSIPWLPEG